MAPAESLRRYQPFFRHKGAASVLDYGAGKLRNSLFLARRGCRVWAADIPEQADRIRKIAEAGELAGILEAAELATARLAVDLVVSTYVFNIIPEGEEQRLYLDNAARALRPGGYLLVEVRCRREEEECGSGCAGYRSCTGCSKSYSHRELDRLVVPHGFRRICHYYRRRALAAVYRRETGIDE